MTDLTAHERLNLQHALGLDRNHVPYRNHFVADPGSLDDLVFVALQSRGLAALVSAPQPGFMPCNLWRATTAGIAAAGAPDFQEGEVA